MASGSIKRDSDGWMFVVDVASPNGKRRQVRRRGFETKKAAETELRSVLGLAENGLYVEPTRLTVGRYLTETWLPSIVTRVRPTTGDMYRRIVDKHVVPALGAVRIQVLDTATVSAFVSALLKKGLSPKTVRNVHAVLSKALADARDAGVVQRNAASAVKLPQVLKRAPRAWSAEQLGSFLDEVESDRHTALWRFLALTGCRRGEALGLRWSDVDLKAGTATLTNQRTIAGGSIVEGAPKTASGARTVALDAATVEALRTWRVVHSSERLLLGGSWPKGDLVFTHPDGNGLWPQTVTSQFKEIATRLELPLIGVHGLRHTAATWMISQGVSPKVVAERLGHSNVSITLGLYTHVMPAHDRAAAEAFAGALTKAPAVSVTKL